MIRRHSGRTGNEAGTDTVDGVSEVIGAVLLISLVVAAVALVAVFINSQATPHNIPDVNFLVGSDNKNPPTLYLTHNGGDTLALGTFSVLVDGTMRSFSISGGGTEWSLGKNLLIPLSLGEKPDTIILVYNATGSGGSVIGSASADVSVPQIPIAPEVIIPPQACVNLSDPQIVLSVVLSNVSVIGDAMNQSPSTIGPVIANVVGGNSITFYKDQNFEVEKTSGNYLRFTVSKSGSAITATQFGSTPKILYPGDIVTIYLTPQTTNLKTFGLGDQIWELKATAVDVNITHNGIPDRRNGGDIYHAWISGYQNVSSTLKISSTGSGTTSLVVNGTQHIDGVSDLPVVITDARPVGLGLFILQEVSTGNDKGIYYVGSAKQVTWM